MTRVVIDASAALHLASSAVSISRTIDFAAPPLLWSEVTSVLHEAVWRGELDANLAADHRAAIGRLGIATPSPDVLHDRAWDLATALGWAKTYDAEYVALAQLVDAPLFTIDLRLVRAVAHLVRIASPADLL